MTSRIQRIVNNPAVGIHAFNFQVAPNPPPNMANTMDEMGDMDFNTEIEFPYDMNAFISIQLMPNITPRQKERNSILEEHHTEQSFQNFF